ncbi:MAG: hypothetical protein ACK4ME_11670 [Fimbriimonadales bacterium]
MARKRETRWFRQEKMTTIVRSLRAGLSPRPAQESEEGYMLEIIESEHDDGCYTIQLAGQPNGVKKP